MLFALWYYLSEDEFMTFNREVTINGKVSPENPIYKKAFDLSLIKEDGALWDLDYTKIMCSVIAFQRSGRPGRPPKAEKKGARRK